MPTVKLQVVKGSTSHGVPKSSRGLTVQVEPVEGRGVKVVGINGTMTFWFSGNRVNVPDLTPDKEYNLHRGDPTQNIRVKVVA